jgi:flagellar protein FlgJ
MALEAPKASFYADPASLTALKRGAAAQTPDAIRETARQFESLFTTMMLKSMREATPRDPNSLFGSDQQDFYQDMFDQQMSVQLSKGKGLGLADVLVRQLMQSAGVTDAAGATDGSGVAGTGAAATAGQTQASSTSQTANWPPRTREEFVEAVMPAARAAASKLGVDPAAVVAHAALETGWGRHMPTGSDGTPSFNLFGIKAGAGWRGNGVNAGTQEYVAGGMQNVDARFRAYGSPSESIGDYANVLQSNPRYSAALGTGSDIGAFATALQRAGYATDPDYARKLTAVADELKSRFGRPISAGEV